MRNKVILVVLDGLNYQVAHDCMGYLSSLIENHQAALYKVQSELPSMSRPLYECILTSKRPIESGIVNNEVVRLSHNSSIFSLARDNGLVTAAAAYHWVSELYNRAPYDAIRDRFTHDDDLNIQHGCFYHSDHYPDEHLFFDAEYLRRQYDPDFLLIHPMNIDDAGHKYGLDSSEYCNAARFADVYLSRVMPQWIDEDYQIIVTSDHGMNKDRSHGGRLAEEREVPMFVTGQQFLYRGVVASSAEEHTVTPKQTEICGLVCDLLGIEQHGKPHCHHVLAGATAIRAVQ